MPKREALKQEPSTGNVFADLGLADAGEHLIKAGLVVRIDRTIRQRKLIQAAAAAVMGRPIRVLFRSSVFADLGLADAGEHLIKAGLVVRIDRTIRQRKLTQAAAAQLMGIDQPKISAMLAGQFRGYSVERLMRFLVALGHDVEIVVKPRRHGMPELRVA